MGDLSLRQRNHEQSLFHFVFYHINIKEVSEKLDDIPINIVCCVHVQNKKKDPYYSY